MHNVKDTWRNCGPGLKWKFFVGLGALILGMIFIVIGVTLQVYLTHRLNAEIKSLLVIDSFEADGYDEWKDNNNPDSAPLYMKYYLFNLTNADELLHASSENTTKIPIYEQVGPFVYRKYTKKENITFSEDGNQVEYNEWAYYVPMPSMSYEVPPQDVLITNLNQAYMGVVMDKNIGSESNLVVVLTGPTLQQLFQSLGQPFALIVLQAVTAQLLPIEQQKVIDDIAKASNISQQQALQVFHLLSSSSSLCFG